MRAWGAALAAAAAVVAAASLPKQGYVYVTWGNDFNSSMSLRSLQTLQQMGVKTLEVVVTQYMAHINDTSIAPGPQTSSDASVGWVIDTAHSLGMAVALKPHVDMYDGAWRGTIGQKYTTEAQWDAWWGNYTAFITHYAALAVDHDAEFFNVGTELDSTEFREADWRAVIAAVRALFKGPMWYGCNWQPGVWAVNWWDALDFIGVDGYFPLATKDDPTEAEVVAAWQPIIANLSAASPKWGKPVVFAEIGYASFQAAAVQPFACCTGPVDLATQATLFSAFFATVWQQPWFAGVFWWAWDVTDIDNTVCSTDFSTHSKPAAAVVAAAYGGSVPPSAAAPSASAVNIVVYQNGSTTLDNWSYYSTVNLKSTANPYPGHAASASVVANANGALVFHSAAGLDFSASTALEFDVIVGNATTSSDLTVKLCTCTTCNGCASSTAVAASYAVNTTCTLPQAWGTASSHIRVPLSVLQVEPMTSIQRIELGNNDGSGVLSFVVDNIVATSGSSTSP